MQTPLTAGAETEMALQRVEVPMLFFHCLDMITPMHGTHTLTHTQQEGNSKFKATIIFVWRGERPWILTADERDTTISGGLFCSSYVFYTYQAFFGTAATSWKLETHERARGEPWGCLGQRSCQLAARWIHWHKNTMEVDKRQYLQQGQELFDMNDQIKEQYTTCNKKIPFKYLPSKVLCK